MNQQQKGQRQKVTHKTGRAKVVAHEVVYPNCPASESFWRTIFDTSSFTLISETWGLA